MKQKYENYNETVEKATKNVFVTTKGKIEAEVKTAMRYLCQLLLYGSK